jgi:hypothetical protein
MAFEYSCFLSYRHHEQNKLAETFINELYSALHDELGVITDRDIFIDRQGMRGGNIIDPKLARALCTSVCMIAVYTPNYFSEERPYCAREYLAMEILEQKRLKRVSGPPGKEAGLIIPVVWRGVEELPSEIRAKRHYYDFQGFSLRARSLSRSKELQPHIHKLADAVHQRAKIFEAIGEELTCDCQNFEFPSENEALPLIKKMKTTAAVEQFPLLGRSQ